MPTATMGANERATLTRLADLGGTATPHQLVATDGHPTRAMVEGERYSLSRLARLGFVRQDLTDLALEERQYLVTDAGLAALGLPPAERSHIDAARDALTDTQTALRDLSRALGTAAAYDPERPRLATGQYAEVVMHLGTALAAVSHAMVVAGIMTHRQDIIPAVGEAFAAAVEPEDAR